MIPHNAEFFDLIPPQEMINFMLKYSFFHKQVIQIPVSIVTEKEIDFDLLKEALNIEIERNDCLRLRFLKKKGKYKQYFIDEFKVNNVEVLSFKTKEEQIQVLTKDAQKPIRHLKGETFRIKFFHSYDGRYGIYLNVCHLCMDASAVFTFFSDLLKIYEHLKDGAPMPKPLGTYKDCIIKELEYINNPYNLAKEEKFYTEFFMKDGDPLYAGVHGPELLENERLKKKKPDLRAPSCFDPFHDKAELTKFVVPTQESKIIIDFMNNNQISPECLMQLGMKLHISKINYRTPDMYFVTLCTRRKTLKEKRAGGTLAEPLPWRIVIEEDVTFKQALEKMAELQYTLFKHMDYPYLECRTLVRKLFNYSPIAASSSMMFSWFPFNKDTMNGWDFEFEGYNLGRYIMPLYTFAMINPKTENLKFSYLYRTNMITPQHIKDLHENTIRAIILGVNNPDMTMGEILDRL